LHLGCGGTANILYPDASPDAAADAAADSRPGDSTSSDGSTDAWVWLNESLNNNPGATNQIHNFVVKADQLSVERDLKGMGVAMAGYEIGVPVERYLTDIMRRLVQEGIWRINEPSARVWNLEGTTYLVWPMAGEEIARRTKDEDIPGLPKTADGILDMMVEREIAFLRDDHDDPFYYISPNVITEKIPNMRMKAIRLRDQALISSMPIAPIPGKIHSSKTGGTTERAEVQGELPLNSQDGSSAPVERLEQAPSQEVPPQSAPRIAGAFSVPTAAPTTQGSCRRSFSSIPTTRSVRGDWHGAPSFPKNRLQMSPTAPEARRRRR